MRTLGKDKSTPIRGQRKTRKAAYGVCGEWLCVTPRWKWDDDKEVNTYVMDDGEKLHIMIVFTFEREAVFTAMNSTWSNSKHLGTRLLYEAAYMDRKLKIWHHGLVRPNIVDKQIHGFNEEHAERLPKVKAPWVPEPTFEERKQEYLQKVKPQEQIVRL